MPDGAAGPGAGGVAHEALSTCPPLEGLGLLEEARSLQVQDHSLQVQNHSLQMRAQVHSRWMVVHDSVQRYSHTQDSVLYVGQIQRLLLLLLVLVVELVVVVVVHGTRPGKDRARICR